MKTKNLMLSLFGTMALMATNNASLAQQPDSTSKVPVVVSIDVANPLCSYSTDGMIKITFNGGFMPYKVNGQSIQGNEFIVTDLSEGEYSFSLQDAGLYNGSTIVSIVNPEPIEVSGFINHVTSFGAQNGAINVSTTATNPTFIWSTSDGSNLNASAEDQSGLTAGVYNLSIIDENGCMAERKYKITQPTKPLVNGFNLSTTFAQANKAPVVYPNPSNGKIDILSDVKEGTVRITNELGLVIKQCSVAEIQSVDLKPGSYNVMIELSNGNVSSEQLVVR